MNNIFMQVYTSKDDPHEVLRIANWMNEEALEQATKSIITPHPNTYTYSKRLSESLVAAESPNMPVCIIRPSIGKSFSYQIATHCRRKSGKLVFIITKRRPQLSPLCCCLLSNIISK